MRQLRLIRKENNVLFKVIETRLTDKKGDSTPITEIQRTRRGGNIDV